MSLSRCLKVLIAVIALATPALSQTEPVEIGGDVFVSGTTITQPVLAERDLIAMGANVSMSSDVAEDVHALGFDVEIDGAVGGDVTAAGASVSVDGPVAGDVTASAMTLRSGPQAEIGGNARFAGASVTINGPIRGALVAAGGEIILNATVAGDVVLTSPDITFGPNAVIEGRLTYLSDDRMEVPERVISADRVTFEMASDSEMWREVREDWQEWDSPVALTPWAVIGGFLVNLGLFIVIGAVFLTLTPGTIRRLRRRADARPGMVMLTGTIGLSILFGSIPVGGLSVVGLPLVPIVLLLILAVWVLGYILGAYVVAMRIMRGLGSAESPSIAMRLVALAMGVTFAALLNFIPVVGWMANFALVLLGAGAITTALFDSFLSGLEPERDQGLAPLDTSDT
ncbi:polymer-forming cytoskeletal protein [Rhodobacteraceae bacterium N5(2021)]|uniref:Polymer-forming cytoskeletal protein n=1 Tax=Gymnodinialimonas phycosphaerae TaxID=2841589 RepID=A0A975TSA8_9RHOB|nr:polymer-forming cytoskeletal protein [Gymnodinialimonas phycosphaerae]MBY4893868.1 polymer-forming cytoskeletal protein [Gymnodinialimonas phycosphaerae]